MSHCDKCAKLGKCSCRRCVRARREYDYQFAPSVPLPSWANGTTNIDLTALLFPVHPEGR